MRHGNPRQAVQLAYLAGILDGEGSFRINRINTEHQRKKHKTKNPSYYAQVQCGMVDKEILEMLLATFGGSLREERVPDRRSIWRWALTGRGPVIDAIDMLSPYLIVKAPQAAVVRAFCAGWQTPYNRRLGVSAKEIQRREDAYQTMRKLNAVGAAATTERSDSREAKATV